MATHPHLNSKQPFYLFFLFLGVAILRIKICFITIKIVCPGPWSSLQNNQCVFHSIPFACSSTDNSFFWLPWGCNKLPQSYPHILVACTSIDYAHICYGCKFRQGFKAGKNRGQLKSMRFYYAAWDADRHIPDKHAPLWTRPVRTCSHLSPLPASSCVHIPFQKWKQ